MLGYKGDFMTLESFYQALLFYFSLLLFYCLFNLGGLCVTIRVKLFYFFKILYFGSN